MSDLEQFQHLAALDAAATKLRIDAATAEVIRAFELAGVRVVVLKGPALDEWYPPDTTRSYLDSDLWVHPDHWRRGQGVLERLDFIPYLRSGDGGEWFQEHAETWWRDRDGVVIDLHHALQGVGVAPNRAWNLLAEPGREIEIAGYPAHTLSAAGQALYVTLHAAHHGRRNGKALAHLEQALKLVEEHTWRDVASLASELRAVDWFAAGLELLGVGEELARRLNLPAGRSVKVALQAEGAPPIALGIDQLLQAQSLHGRLSLLARKLFPPPAFVRHWWPPAARSQVLLMVGYVYRPIWLVWHSPGGWRAWVAARRAVRRHH